AHMVGKMDFQSFCDLKNSKKSTVRRVDSITITREGEDLVLDFRGEGFLYHMIRIMVGTLAEVGAGRMLPGQIPGILAACDRKQAGPLAPACGLRLMEVRY
ncbi:MAG: tRNA pseudouridine(38-40) synthase TruA, partial [Clostridia bacterium]|nr:tRNA pseudouridine(38-40) synthase TruA [Clostridia bacterium]